MSAGGLQRHRSESSRSKSSTGARQIPPPAALTPESTDPGFEPCAATASFLLYAQRNQILVLHHDTLAIERRFDLHREQVLWVFADNSSERGSGRLAVSYDAGNTAIVWDILTGGEVARFSAYEHMKVASFMRNGNIAFGNDQGNIILFEPATSEHISARTIFDPITAIAPSSDCRTFAIGYLNGSILIATLQPSFTILHTLTTTRAPSRIAGLAWHGSSSKQKTDMLATQTLDGDLRVWSVPKPPLHEPPTIIRVLQRADTQRLGPCWFAWSKNGRIVQYAEGETRSWDVRTKKVSWEVIPTVAAITGIAVYGPTATLFTLNRNHQVVQYDISPNSTPMNVASVQHFPANTPPTPPTTFEEEMKSRHARMPSTGAAVLPTTTETESSSADDGDATMSPLQKIAREMDSLDALQSEIRDKVMPLSPESSRASSASSRSSGGRRKYRKYLYDRPDSSHASSQTGYEGTEFSHGASSSLPRRQAHESISIRSVSSYTSNTRHRSSNLRKEIMRSPDEATQTATMDLFPYTRARLRDVPLRTPHYGNTARTPDLLQREMLSVVFGWNDTARALVRDELSRHRIGSASGVLLSKWLGDNGADSMAAMVGSESMTSSDWMLLALSSIGADSQKKVGEAFVQRLLEKGDVHPAAAILIGLAETNDAIEVYFSQGYILEAVLLTCLACPADWGRISHLIRKWGEVAVQQGQTELAVRCFSCTSIETSEPWFSPRAQDAVFTAQQERFTQPSSAGAMSSPPLSPPSRSGSLRMTAKNASLKLVTTFGSNGVPTNLGASEPTPINALGVTPIAQSALSPGGAQPWQQPRSRNIRDPSSARTATPGGFSRKNRLPSRDDIDRVKQETANYITPITASHDFAPTGPQTTSRRTSSVGSVAEPPTAVKATAQQDFLAPESSMDNDHHLPSPAQGVFTRLREDSRGRNTSTERRPRGLEVQVLETRYTDSVSPGPSTNTSQRSMGTSHSGAGTLSPPLTGGSTRSAKGRAVDNYVNSVNEARELAREKRAQSKRRGDGRKRDESRGGRTASRRREPSETRERHNVRYIKPAKRSPSSPVPMSPEEIAQASQGSKADPATTDDENFYKIASPVESHKSIRSGRSDLKQERRLPSVDPTSDDVVAPLRTRSRATSRQRSPESGRLRADSGRGRSQQRGEGSTGRSPSSPLPMPAETASNEEQDDTNSDGYRVRLRSESLKDEELQARRADSRGRRERSSSRKPSVRDESLSVTGTDLSKVSIPEEQASTSSLTMSFTEARQPRGLSRKELAAKELEERRMSLARRPSAPQIPMPGDIHGGGNRPSLGQRSHTELGNSPHSYVPPLSRSQTVDPEQMSRYGKLTGTSTPSAPIGLPATPRAMRHPRYMSSDPNDRDAPPPVPEIPDNVSGMSSVGSSVSRVTGSNLSQLTASNVSSEPTKLSQVEGDQDIMIPLLPSSVFSQADFQALSRSASAPPEKMAGVHPAYKPMLPHPTRRLSNVRKISPPDTAQAASLGPVASIDEALAISADQQVIIIPEEQELPIVLPELQHLAGPPPPPPVPTMFGEQSGPMNSSGVISIAIEESTPGPGVDVPTTLPATTFPQPMERATTASPSAHRRGRGSVSDTFGSRFRGFGERMRSTSRSRAKSPPQEAQFQPSPYETVLPPMPMYQQANDITMRAKSPYEQAMAAQGKRGSEEHIPVPPPAPSAPPGMGMEGKIQETAIPPSTLPTSRSQSAMGGYRNPKDIRANMPPETLQQGVYGSGGFL